MESRCTTAIRRSLPWLVVAALLCLAPACSSSAWQAPVTGSVDGANADADDAGGVEDVAVEDVGAADVGVEDVSAADASAADAAGADSSVQDVGVQDASTQDVGPEDMSGADDMAAADDMTSGDAEPFDAGFDPTGNIASACGSPMQGLTPVNCTKWGDVEAFCVFGNHCGCSDGFVCEKEGQWGGKECDPGVVCVPESGTTIDQTGHIKTSCGHPDQGLTPVDCTQFGDKDAQCVFSNHCMCSENYECTPPGVLAGKECKPGATCIWQ